MTSRHFTSEWATGLGRMTRLGLRTGWLGLLAVVLAVAGLVTGIASGIDALYPELADRQQYAATIGASPATQAFNGLGYGLTTIGGLTAYEVGFLGQLLFPLLALHVALRHTRRDEEAGRIELLAAGQLGRLTPLAAGTLLLAGTCLLTGAVMLLGLVAVGLPATGSAWYAASIVLLMVLFGVLGLLLGQLAQSTRTAYLVGLALITVAYLVRAVVDGLGWKAVWASPLAWTTEIRPVADPQPWPIVAYGAGALVLLTFAVLVARRRDLGAGVLTPRPGPAQARPALGTVTGMAWRLTRPAALSWAVLAIAWAACFGLLTREMASLVDANPVLLEALGVQRGAEVVASLAVVVICLAATAVAVQGAGRFGLEETTDRWGAVLATRLPRPRLWLGWWAVVAASALTILILGAAVFGLTGWAATGDRHTLTMALKVGFGYAVPVLFVAAVAAVLRASLPRVAGVAWVLVGWIVLVGFLAETLRLPNWARDLSPLHLVGPLPQGQVSAIATVGLGVAVLVLLAASTIMFGRRDLRVG